MPYPEKNSSFLPGIRYKKAITADKYYGQSRHGFLSLIMSIASYLYYSHLKLYFMPDNKTDSNNYGRQSNESERDLAAKGGPVTGLGNPDGKHNIQTPYDSDLQTQIAAKSKDKDKKKRERHDSL